MLIVIFFLIAYVWVVQLKATLENAEHAPKNASLVWKKSAAPKTAQKTTNLTEPNEKNKNDTPVVELSEERAMKEVIAKDVESDRLYLSNSNESDIFDVTIEIAGSRDAWIYGFPANVSHVFENTCRFPVLNKDDPDIINHSPHFREIDCTQSKKSTSRIFPPLVHQHPNGEILISRPHRSPYKTFDCSYAELTGTIPNKGNVKVGDWHPVPHDQRFLVHKDQFVIRCVADNRLVYHNAFAWVSDKPKLKPPVVNVPRKYSISLLAIDSTSRNQFFRHMPYTLKFMRNNDFQILNGYTKIGDNSAINWLSLLTGKVYHKDNRGFAGILDDDADILLSHIKSDFTNAESLFRDYKDAGCVTMWNDDIAMTKFGLFHYFDFNGFRKPPANYYFRPYYEYLYQKLQAASGCSVHGTPIVRRWLDLWEGFDVKYSSSCRFSFNFFTGLTHASSSTLELFDEPVSEGLERMKAAGVLDNTIVVIMGDHGQRISPIKKTQIGRIEERMSMMGIYLPEKFKKEFPEAAANLKINVNRLTSNFDVHETLAEITDITLGKKHNKTRKHGTSLFKTIPTNRSCPEALIPENFCMCMENKLPEKAQLPSDIASQITTAIQNHVADIIPNLACVTEYTLTPVASTPSAYAISRMAEVTSLKDFTFLAETPDERHIVDLEFNFTLALTLAGNEKSKALSANLVSRLQFDTQTSLLQLNTAPWLNVTGCEKRVYTIAQVCRCA